MDHSDDRKLTLKDVAAELAISEATARNWMRLGKLKAALTIDNVPYFSAAVVNDIKVSLLSGQNAVLRSRRNKKYASGNNIYKSYVDAASPNLKTVKHLIVALQGVDISDELMGAILRDCAVQLLKSRFGSAAGEYMFLVAPLVSNSEISGSKISGSEISDSGISGSRISGSRISGSRISGSRICDSGISGSRICDSDEFVVWTPNGSSIHPSYTYITGEDTLGLLYISLRSLRDRKAMGSYYTPAAVAAKLVEELFKNTVDVPYSDNSPVFSEVVDAQIFDHNLGDVRILGSYLADARILDPCCGSCNFILQLPDFVKAGQVYAFDIDPLSVSLGRINFALKYAICNASFLNEHVKVQDFLLLPDVGSSILSVNSDFATTSAKSDSDDAAFFDNRFNIILGNPPWGFDYSIEEKASLARRFSVTTSKTAESFDLFIEQALRLLSPGGRLSFVLPESLLNVRLHRSVRKLLKNSCSFHYINYLGNIFDKVQCPSIILQVDKTDGLDTVSLDTSSLNAFDLDAADLNTSVFGTSGLDDSIGDVCACQGLLVELVSSRFVIRTPRDLSASFNFRTTDEEYALLNKLNSIDNKVTLKRNARFALGIVTGNNASLISTRKFPNSEIILKGSDIDRYKIEEVQRYVSFARDKFQQCAPDDIYRAPEKLLYRFISNQLIFAYDNKQRLSLNSCNILIPEIDGLDIKYVLAVLNSRMAQFFFEKNYASVKVLRSHLEAIPIPFVNKKAQEEVTALVDLLNDDGSAHTSSVYQVDALDCTANVDHTNVPDRIDIYNHLDALIASLYKLTNSEYALIKSSIQTSKNEKITIWTSILHS